MKLTKTGLEIAAGILNIKGLSVLDNDNLTISNEDGQVYLEYNHITEPKAVAGFVTKRLTSTEYKVLKKYKIVDKKDLLQ